MSVTALCALVSRLLIHISSPCMHFILLITFIVRAFLVRKIWTDIFNFMVTAKYFPFRRRGVVAGFFLNTDVSNRQDIMRLPEWNLYESCKSNNVTGVSNQVTQSRLYDKG